MLSLSPALTQEDVQRIHARSLDLLETVGIDYKTPTALEILEEHGCEVDFSKNSYENRERAMQGDDQYGTKEEKRVITGSEQKTAKANGEIQGDSGW